MTIESNVSKTVFATDGKQVEFPLNYRFAEPEHLEVYWISGGAERLYLPGADFTVIGDDYGKFDNGGTVAFVRPPPPGTMSIRRQTPITQESDYEPNGPVPADTLEGDLDKSAMIDQELQEQLSRCFMVSPGSDKIPSPGYFFDVAEALLALYPDLQAIRDAVITVTAAYDAIMGIGWDYVAFTNRENHFTEMVTVPDTGKGTSSAQAVNARSLQRELEDFIIDVKTEFSLSSWQLITAPGDPDAGRYQRNIVTDMADFTHVYRNEDYGSRAWDHMVEVQMRAGYIRLLTTDRFAGFIRAKGPRRLPTYNYSPIVEDGVITGLALTGLAANPQNVTELHLPSSADYEGRTYPVVEIGMDAFAGNNNINRVHVGAGTRIIRSGAFRNMASLVYAFTPDTVEIYGDNAFYSSSALVEFVGSASARRYGAACFYGCDLRKFSIQANLEFLGEGALSCRNLAEITVDPANQYFKDVDGVLFSADGGELIAYPPERPGDSYAVPDGTEALAVNSLAFNGLTELVMNDGLRSIGNRALFGSRLLTALHIKPLVESIGFGVTAGSTIAEITVDPANTHYKSVDGVLLSADGKRLVQYPSGKAATSYAFPAGVEELETYAMYAARFTTVTPSASLRVMANEAIINCLNLTALHLPAALSSLGAGAIGRNPQLAAVTVDPANARFKAIDGVLFSADGKDLVYYPTAKTATAYAVPAGVENILYGAIRPAGFLTALTFPASLRTMGAYAVSTISGITELDFGENAELLAVAACTNLSNLHTVKFRNPATVMAGAFPNCPALLHVYGHPGSTAEAFAAANTLIFVAL